MNLHLHLPFFNLFILFLFKKKTQYFSYNLLVKSTAKYPHKKNIKSIYVWTINPYAYDMNNWNDVLHCHLIISHQYIYIFFFFAHTQQTTKHINTYTFLHPHQSVRTFRDTKKPNQITTTTKNTKQKWSDPDTFRTVKMTIEMTVHCSVCVIKCKYSSLNIHHLHQSP